MSTHTAVLLDPTEVLPRIDVRPRLPRPARVTRRSALVVQPRRERPAAPLVDVLLAHGLDPVVTAADDDCLPDPGSSPLAILVGTEPLGQARPHGRLERELEWIRRADEAGTAVLGIGHGARVLALAFGGAVEPAEHALRGWTLLDTIVPHIIAGGPWLSWQHDIIGLPPAATLLAHNRLGPQAFGIGRHLAVQFHPEATPEVVVDWTDAPDELSELDAHLSLVARDPAAAAACAHRLLSSFIDSV
jgi:GMP synthase-like glutamine amidotransferase